VENVMKPGRSPRAVLPVALSIAFGFVALSVTTLNADPESGLIDRVVAQTTRSGLTIRGTRHLHAATSSGKHEGWMRVVTTQSASGGFSWQVIEEGGSSRTREKVFCAVLETEADSWRDGDRDAAALTPANYVFTPTGTISNNEVKIRLEPRRKDSRLIDGFLFVSADGYPVRLEGRLAKSPSFWVKSVQVVKHYGRFAGVALPTRVESVADLKLFGRSTFTMRYTYTQVNGQSFQNVSTADSAQ
jgi:hypothetical protein